MSRESNSRRIHQAVIDALEARRLLADFASVNAGGTLSVVGTSNNDTITIDQSGSNIVARRGSQSLSFASAAVKRFWVNAFRGNDRVTINVARPSTIVGSSGNDTLTGGNNKDSIDGDTGNDRLDGRGDADILNGGDGDDTFSPGIGDDTGDAGAGLLTLDYSNAASGEFSMTVSRDGAELRRPLTGENDAFTFLPQEGDLHVSLIGTAGDDQISAFIYVQNSVPLSMAVNAAGGDDFLTVASGFAFNGPPTIALGGDGDDTIKYYGEDFFTTSINGGAGDDLIIGEGGTVALLTRSALQIDGGGGRDKVILDPSRRGSADPLDVTVPTGVEIYDVSAFNEERLRVHGNSLNNVIRARAGQVTINGNAGNDELIAIAVGSTDPDPFPAIAQLNGGSGNDTLVGGASDDVLNGGDGDDTYSPGIGDDTGDAGDGLLTLDYTTAAPGSFFMVLDDGFARVDRTQLGEADEFAFAPTQPNVVHVSLLGTSGDDNIRALGRSGNGNFIYGLAANGGSGDDSILATSADSDLSGETPIIAQGGEGDDTLKFLGEDEFTSSLIGGAGNDTIVGMGGSLVGLTRPGTKIDGGTGRDKLVHQVSYRSFSLHEFSVPPGVENLQTGSFPEERLLIHGNSLDNIIEAEAGQVTINGNGGNDTLIAVATGYTGDEIPLPAIAQLDGGSGNDTLVGGDSDDDFYGGAGDDTFITGGGNNTGDAGTGRLTIDLTGTTPGEISGSIRSTNNNAVGRFIVDAPDSQSSFLYDVTGGNTSVFLLATGGDDDVSMLVVPAIVESVDIPITVSGGAGNDNVFAGRRFPIGETPIVALGGDGNDTLQTSREEFVATRTEGGDGDDQFFIPGGNGPKPGEIIGGNGFDFIEAEAFTVDRPIATVTIPSGVEKLRLTGDSRDSFIVTGNDLPNDIEVFGLGATIRGAGGSDKIVFHALPSSSHQLNTSYLEGGAGNDSLISDDSLIGGASADTMLGNSGDDFLEGNAGNDNLFGGSGNDTLVGGAGRDLLHGQDGDDRIFALDNEIDTIDGGAGFDRAQRDNAGSIVDSVSNIEQFI